MNAVVGDADIVFITLDTLRYDAADAAFRDGRLPCLAPLLGTAGWQRRHTPASFTFPAHQAFFSGFLPTPTSPGPHPRLFAAAFPGSESTNDGTFVFPQATLPAGLAAQGYRTICVGGTGFFNGQSELGSVLPSMFDEHHWDESLGVTCPASAQNQVRLAIERVEAADERVFLFINISAMHQPNWFYGGQPEQDTLETHTEALCSVDAALPPLFATLRARGETFCIVCSDHGTTYGEDGYRGHRLAHEAVWTVPYAEFVL